ncbi:MAG TPA: putative Ig domain-containing protein [Arenimonas sp.]|uniref:putative Ig domain-containing protein n=1 Tax=Arenimonas sp. TaxID=1872635 RepID=UPI002D80C777|nr:putative Ig domain-containing protein [Arenimonas sp.]HEU0153471.1 putative Ig domain-containing protein [Arenimonas sp.]
MVAVFTGNALGLFDTSLTQLGSGLSWDAARNRQSVNAANGNLVLQGLDELIQFRGMSVSATRTYNSLGTVAGVGADAWLTGFERKVELIGALDGDTSKVIMHTGDGSEVEFSYSGTPGKYVTTDGSGAHDTMVWQANYWIYDEGSSGHREYFKSDDSDPAGIARLHQIRNTKSEAGAPTYFLVDYNAAGQVTAVRASDGTGNNADALLFAYNANGQLVSTSTRESGFERVQVRYGYDTQGRLEWVEHDLTLRDTTDNVWDEVTASYNDGHLFRTTYTYVDSTSLRIATVRSSDGLLSSYTYDAQGRVETVTRGDTNINDADGLGETLTFTYDGLRTDVVDSQGRMWSYHYDGAGQLTQLAGPARDGLRDVTAYVYDSAGNLLQAKTTRGATVLSQTDYQYDASGNVLWEWDALGNAVSYTYTTANQLASRTVYTGVTADRTGDAPPPGGQTTHFVYDTQNRLRFTVGPQGQVTEVSYADSGNGVGQQHQARSYVAASYSGVPGAAEIAAWASANLAGTTLTEFSYDARGLLQRRVDYASVSSITGAGVVDAAMAVTRYTHDAQGLLRAQTTVRGTNRLAENAGNTVLDSVVDYVYDGMGRLLDLVQRSGDVVFDQALDSNQIATDVATLSDAHTQITRYLYLDSGLQLKVMQDGGATRIETRNAAGRLMSTVDEGAAVVSRATQNFYNSAGQLRASQDANGGRTYFFYDERGNVAAEVDATGAITEYVRDGLDRVVQTRSYAQRVNTVGWIDGGAVTANDFASVRPVDQGQSRVISRSYDAANRLVSESDGVATTTYAYDGAGRLLQTVRAAAGQDDRVTRYFYDASGRTVATLDAEGYLTEQAFDFAGRVVKSTRYAHRKPGADTLDGTLDQLRPDPSAGDQIERFYYDARGQQIGHLDVEGYLSRRVFHETGNYRVDLRYGKRLTGLTGSETFGNLVSSAAAGTATDGLRQSRQYFDALGRVTSEINHEGTTTRYHYDQDGRLTRTEQAQGTTEVRNGSQWYDVFGQLIGELAGANAVDASGNARITDTMSEAEKTDVFAAYGVRHSYDLLGRRIETIDAEGNKTWYFYDARGQQTFLVRGVEGAAGKNAHGEVTETRYNAFGQASETLAYTGRINIDFPRTRDEVQSAITTLTYVAAVDGRQQFSYDQRGLLISQISAEGSVSHFRYTGFGELYERDTAVGTAAMSTSRFEYDRRGMLVAQIDNPGPSGPQRTTSTTYDAFGRVLSSTDARGNEVTHSYDRLGRLISQSRSVYQGLTGLERIETVSSTYDAFGRSLTHTNAMGQATTYSYDDATRSLVVTSAQGLSVTTVRNRHGETLTVTDPAGAVTTYEYDQSGQLTRTINPVEDFRTSEYDARGLLAATVDVNGTRTTFTYDAVGRVLTRTEDAGTGKLNLTTTYAYDGQGRNVTVTDPLGKITTLGYDREGRVLTSIRDTNGLALQTTYAWDAAGRQLSVIEGDGTPEARTVRYAYDALGRRISETVDPGTGKLNLVTEYGYDANGNVTTRTGADGHITHFVYDEANRLVFSIDPMGGVSRQWYDEAGRLVASRQYAAPISLDAGERATLATANVAASISLIQGKTLTNDSVDRVEYRLLDRDGRLRYSLNAQGHVVEQRYDTAGRPHHRLAYASAVSLDPTFLAGLLQPGERTPEMLVDQLQEVASELGSLEAAAQSSYGVINGAGRERFVVTRVNASQGYVTERTYDDEGRVTSSIVHFTLVTYDPGASPGDVIAQLSGAPADSKRVTSYAYDALGRLRFTVDSEGAVSEQRYDKRGAVNETRLYMTPVSGVAINEAAMAAAVEGQTDYRATTHLYDGAGRLVRSTDALDNFERFEYDAVGNRISHTNKLNHVTTYEFDAAGRMIRATDALENFELFGYDAVGNRTSYTDKLGKVWTYAYDGAGRLIEEKTPEVQVYRYTTNLGFSLDGEPGSIATRMTYDALDNLLTRTENADAVNLAERRTTTYTYDARGNQIRTNFPDAWQINTSGELVATGQPSFIEVTYNALGQAVVQKDVLGNFSYKVYDRVGRLSHDIDAAGFVTRYQYNAAGEQTQLQRYANALDTSLLSGWSPGTAIGFSQLSDTVLPTNNADRILTTSYDSRGLKTSVTQPSVTYWKADGTSANGTPRTEFSYDALGQLVRESVLLEGTTWAHTHHYYDALGRRSLSVDAEGYISGWEYDAAGQEIIRVEFARAINTATLTTHTPPALPAAGNLDTGYDRAVVTTYDALGRKTSETSPRLFQDADGSSGMREVSTVFEYDAEGRTTGVIADGERTTTTYDALGRTLSVLESLRLVLRGERTGQVGWVAQLGSATLNLGSTALYELVNPYTEMAYDAFGNAVRVMRFAQGRQDDLTLQDNTGSNQTTLTRYDRQGRAVATRDAEGNATFTAYDAADRAVHTWRNHSDHAGAAESAVAHGHYTYDAVGRQTSATMTRVVGGTTHTDSTEFLRHNAFGEVIAKAYTAAALDTPADAIDYTYDRAGNLASDDSSGSLRNYRYNLAGHQVGETRSFSTGTATLTTVTTQRLDRLGRAVATIMPGASLDPAQTVATSRVLDRWGNALEEIDPRGNVVTWVYNDRNQAIQQFAPRVLVVSETGVESWQRPETRWMYDAVGRLIGIRDANGHVDRNEYDAAGRLVRSIDAMGSATLYGYDALGRSVAQQDALGYISTRRYDRMDRIIAVGDYLTANDGATRTAHDRESYALNENGDRVRVSVHLDATTQLVQRYGYDTRGKLIYSESAAGQTNTIRYDAQGNKSFEQNGIGGEQSWIYDVHGRLTSHVDLGNASHGYTYQANGQLATETNTRGLLRTITYFANGQIQRIDEGANNYTIYKYDDSGNRTYEESRFLNNLASPSVTTHVVTRVVYDSHNRISRVVTEDLMRPVGQRITLDLEYSYDAVGNRRRVVAYSGHGPGVAPLTDANDAPIKQADLPDVTLKHGQPIEWRWHPGDHFNDPDGDTLIYTVTQDPTGALPAWLTYHRDQLTGEWVFSYDGTSDVGQTRDILIRATDPSGLTVTDSFTVTVVSDTAPVLREPGAMTLLHKTSDAFLVQFEADEVFLDTDVGETLTLSVVGTVPPWLVVDPHGSSLRLSAAAGAVPTGQHTITLRATDSNGEWVNKTIHVQAAPAAAPVGSAVPSQTAVAGTNFLFESAISAIFTDPNGDSFSVSATLSNGSPLPNWLSFGVENVAGVQTLRFTGVVPDNVVHQQAFNVRLTALDSDSMSAHQDFTITLSNPPPNVAPEYSHPIADQIIGARKAWTYTLPANTFTDANVGDTLIYSASTRRWVPPVPEGRPGHYVIEPLPSWLVFDAPTRTFTGTPPALLHLEVQISARDASNDSAVGRFFIMATESEPVYNGGLTAKSANEGDTVSYPLPANSFEDANGDPLTYTGHVLVGGSWQEMGTLGLSINGFTGQITGTINSAPQGTYTVRVTATDGTTPASGTFTLTVNRRPTAPANTSVGVTIGVPFTQTVPGFSDPEGGALTFSATTSTGAATPAWLTVNASNGTLSGTPPAGFTGLAVLVRATDAAGLWASTAVSLNVVNPPPQYVGGSIPSSFTVTGGNAWSYQFPASAFTNLPTSEAVTFSARLSSGAALPAWLAFDAATRTFSGAPPVNSNTIVVLQVTDEAGGVATTSFTITGTSNPPEYNGILVNRVSDLGQAVNWTLPAGAFTDPNHQALTYTAQVLRPAGSAWLPGDTEPTQFEAEWVAVGSVGLTINANTGAITGTPGALTLYNGSDRWFYDMRIIASDGSAAVTGGFSVSVRRPPVPPASTTLTAYANLAFSRQITFTDPEGGALTYSATGLPAGVSLSSSGVLTGSGTPAGNYWFTVYATDPSGAVGSAVFMLDSQNIAPNVPSPVGNQVLVRDQSWSLNVAGTFSDYNGDALTWSASGMPPGIGFDANAKVFAGTPTTAGAWTVVLTANDGAGGVTNHSFTMTVNAPMANQAPVLVTPLPDVNRQGNRNITITVPVNTFSDANGDPLTYSATGMPGGMTFNPSTRTFSYLTPYGGGANLITVHVSDGRGGTASDSFWLYVAPVGGTQQQPYGTQSQSETESTSFEPDTAQSSELFAAMAHSVELAQGNPSLMATPESIEMTSTVETTSTEEEFPPADPIGDPLPNSSMPAGTSLNRQEAWYTYDAENRVQIVNGKLEAGQILVADFTSGQVGYLLQYDALGRQATQIHETVYGRRIQAIDYTQRGERWRTYDISEHGGMYAYAPQVENIYDGAGRLARTVSYFHADQVVRVRLEDTGERDVRIGGLLSQVIEYTYDDDGRLLTQTTSGRVANQSSTSTSPEWLLAILVENTFMIEDRARQSTDTEVLTLLEEVLYTTDTDADNVRANDTSSYDSAGRLTSYRYIRHWAGDPNGVGAYNPLANQNYGHQYQFNYEARGGYLETSVTGSLIYGDTNFRATTTTSRYDSSGRRVQIEDFTPLSGQPDLKSRRELAYTADGQAMARYDYYYDEEAETWKQGREETNGTLINLFKHLISDTDWANLSSEQREAVYAARDRHRMTYVGGQLVATQDEAGKLDVTGQLTGFSNTNLGRTQVQVQQGDTLRSLAQRVYGNENLWYVLADANGLDSDSQLVAGSTLTAPEIKTSSNDASTFKPYNPGEITGPTTPSLPYIEPPDKGCGVIAQVIMIVIVVVVSIYTAGALSGAVGSFGQIMAAGAGAMTSVAGAGAAAVGSMIGSFAGQLAGNVMGVVDGFSFKDIAVAGLTAYGGAMIGGALKGKEVFQAAGNIDKLNPLGRAVQGAASYGNSVVARSLVGQRTDFSWRGVAAAAIGSGASALLGGRPSVVNGLGEVTDTFFGNLQGSLIDGAATAGARRWLGVDRETDWTSVAADAFGNAIANTIVGVAAGRYARSVAERINQEQPAAPNQDPLGWRLGSGGSERMLSMSSGGGGSGGDGAKLSSGVPASSRVPMPTQLPPDGTQWAWSPMTESWYPALQNATRIAGVEVRAEDPWVNPIVAKYYASQGVGVIRPELFARQYEARSREMGYDPAALARVQVVHQAPKRYYATHEEVANKLRVEQYFYAAGMMQAFAPSLIPALSAVLPVAGTTTLGYGRAGGELAWQSLKAVGSSPLSTIQGLMAARSWTGAYAALYANMPGNVASATILAETAAEGYVAGSVLLASRRISPLVADTAVFRSSSRGGEIFDPVKLAKIQASLERRGVTFVTGDEGARLANALGGEALYMPLEPGRPGAMVFGPNPTRTQVIEELLHFGQHQRIGFEPLNGRLPMFEVQAQNRLLEVGPKLGWTQSELSQIQRAREQWLLQLAKDGQ